MIKRQKLIRKGFEIENLVKLSSGYFDKKTNSVKFDDHVDYSSNFVTSINNFIAREFAKLEFRHKIYTTLQDGTQTKEDKLNSDIYETLTYAANDEDSNTVWRTKMINTLLTAGRVYLKPKYDNTYSLKSLPITTAEEFKKNKNDVIVLVSPFVSNDNNTSLFDALLSSIANDISNQPMKAYLKINAAINSANSDFATKAKEQLAVMSDVSSINGIGILDGKTELIELKNKYSSIDAETVKVVKQEVLNAYNFSEKLLNGQYSETDYKNFFESVIRPLIDQIEKEFTYKLLSNNARINTGKKTSFERIKLEVDMFKFASVSDLISLTNVNTNGSILTVNEVRKLYNVEPIVGGDVFRTNLNSVEIKKENTEEKDHDKP